LASSDSNCEKEQYPPILDEEEAVVYQMCIREEKLALAAAGKTSKTSSSMSHSAPLPGIRAPRKSSMKCISTHKQIISV